MSCAKSMACAQSGPAGISSHLLWGCTADRQGSNYINAILFCRRHKIVPYELWWYHTGTCPHTPARERQVCVHSKARAVQMTYCAVN